jgi:hypothetical protein
MGELKDARGVAIAPGDTALYGFGVSRSVAMAEAVVLGATVTCGVDEPYERVSTTPSGRVRLRVVRRSYSSGEKPIVDVAPDRLVVLKQTGHGLGRDLAFLPPSPLPTQAEEARAGIGRMIGIYTENLRSTEPPSYWGRKMAPGTPPELILADYHSWLAKQLARLRRKLEALDAST